MSRIDQALSRGRQQPAPADGDTAAENPWEIAHADAATPAAPEEAPAEQAPAHELVRGDAGDTLLRATTKRPDARTIAEAQMPDIASRLGDVENAEKIVGSNVRPEVIEEYRRLAALMHHTQLDRGTQVLIVTSAVAGEGKTLTATNLALTLSGSYGRSVLLVDADLRRPSLHRMFNVTNATGLSDLLAVDNPSTPALMAVSPRLTLLTAGRPDPDPMAALTSNRMNQLIAEARAGFDWVIIDTPPVGLLTDASLLAQMVDLALLVVRAESTPYELVQRATEAIGRHRIGGVILNRVSKTTLGDTGRYAEYYGAYTTPRRES